MINGSELTTPSRKQQAYTLEFIQTVMDAISEGRDNFFISVPMKLYMAINWSDVEVFAHLQHLRINEEGSIDDKHRLLHIIVDNSK